MSCEEYQESPINYVIKKEEKTTKTHAKRAQRVKVNIDDRSESLLIIPIEETTDVDSNSTEYLDVQIQLEPNNKIKVWHKGKAVTPSRRSGVYEKIEPCFNAEERPFKCSSCPKSFTTKQHLDRHTNLHTKQKLYPCHECDKVHLDKSYLIRHMTIHSGEKNYVCDHCQKTFRTASSLKRHITTHDPSLRPHVCSDCGKRFPDNSSFKKHIHTHSGVKTHICTICAKGFAHVGDLNIHMKSHDIVKHFRCDDCGREFSRNNNLLRHKAVHAGDGNHKCMICQVCFQHGATLTRHILSSHPSNHKCAICNECFQNAATLNRHILYCHTTDLEVQRSEEQHYESEASEEQFEEEESASEDSCSQADSYEISVSPGSQTISEKRVQNDVSEQIELVRSSRSSFEIYQFDSTGSLVRITDAVSLQSMLQLTGQPPSEVFRLRSSNKP